MTRTNTRRAFLQGIGGIGVIGVPTRTADEGTTTGGDTTVTATDLVIPASEVPPGFESYPTPNSNSFIDALEELTLDVTSTDIAVQGYWSGEVQSDPEWVLSSVALVSEDPLPRTSIETAAQQSYDEYVEAYRAETTPLIEFDQSYTRGDQVSDWRVEIFEKSLFHNSNEGAEHILTDRMRHQFLGNVVLGTLAFGPTDTDPPIKLLLDEYATLQRTLYDTHGAMA
ncbi:hypothetical protein [Salinibaculum rarum]|uniref:hypothetical protein n=1 Tax=Salinibaculum rarum TaxID=3058903 RepID=UPI00265E53BB|nr:hypothetical protein [Salinibaculum sp. KK48]